MFGKQPALQSDADDGPKGTNVNITPILADKPMVSQKKEKTELASNASSPVKEPHLEPRNTVVCDYKSYWVVPNSEIVPEWLEEGEAVQEGTSKTTTRLYTFFCLLFFVFCSQPFSHGEGVM
ncbi:hypothetical protein BpHYR1_005179 [Brachionus plicatilis]|uniref:Uncharacterized protein n=1 Tax=Brachionus plicatilis TaxID=10195 RepID=A0A3M7RQC1_BRAPC|nr:hypothetical protein BpHYR1_005179 [Brachionus plicatilis]